MEFSENTVIDVQSVKKPTSNVLILLCEEKKYVVVFLWFCSLLIILFHIF